MPDVSWLRSGSASHSPDTDDALLRSPGLAWAPDEFHEGGNAVKSRSSKRTQEQLTSAFDDVMETIERVTDSLGDAAATAGDEARTELAALPEQLADARRAIVAAVEPYRPPKQYRRYVQLGLFAVVVAAATAVIVRR
jgi:hypothetical protein